MSAALDRRRLAGDHWFHCSNPAGEDAGGPR